jgi:hypothetical protein
VGILDAFGTDTLKSIMKALSGSHNRITILIKNNLYNIIMKCDIKDDILKPIIK